MRDTRNIGSSNQLVLWVAAILVLGSWACEESPQPQASSAMQPARSTPSADRPDSMSGNASGEQANASETRPGNPASMQPMTPTDNQPGLPGTQPSPQPSVPQDPCMNGIDPGSVVPRRLSSVEYRNSVRDLLGIDTIDIARFPQDEEALGFDNQAASLQMSPIHAESFRSAAEAIAKRAVEDMDTLLGCDAADDEQSCVDAFIRRFGKRVWRRPISQDEANRLAMVYQSGRGIDGGSMEAGISLLLEVFLQSPNFLYRIEVGTPVPDGRGWNILTSYELATKLSYLLWRTTPDDTLLDAADNQKLQTSEQIGLHVERMLNDPRSRDAFWTFFAQWLHLDELKTLVRDTQLYPDFGDAQRDALRDSARDFIEKIVWTEDASMSEIFSRRFSVDGDPANAERAGILSHPAFLAVTSKPNMTSPIHRGVFVREQLFCMPLPPPPPDAMVVAPDPDPNLTTREIFEIHTAEPACAGCHELIDPIGLGFENFDEMGLWREEETESPSMHRVQSSRPPMQTGPLMASWNCPIV